MLTMLANVKAVSWNNFMIGVTSSTVKYAGKLLSSV